MVELEDKLKSNKGRYVAPSSKGLIHIISHPNITTAMRKTEEQKPKGKIVRFSLFLIKQTIRIDEKIYKNNFGE